MVNFNISSSEGYLSKEADFIKLYNEGVIVRKIRERLSLTSRAYNLLYWKCVEDGSIIPRSPSHSIKKPKKSRDAKNYYKNTYSKTYTIVKNNEYYTCVNTLKEAEMFVELMEQCNWDKSKIEEVKKKCLTNLKEN